ncbi:succinoglycan biosynthesis protein [Jannaschia pagri]|uniref:Succinoglycan biosynthesis protein n=1 Tax=Jannaschia pagri TaxID=2829797 RepID=A0ABQ4NJ76_9RHOB|nr:MULTISPECIES: thermonuclease family protein [unclassified Jannaschia]GIT90549.1 succinoglycan biosynthesis protein [Jannaschia sp. AI_61]GIT94381.1 succinoglycan biosynthesis protein [Jannaschia sp. AI_62]
MFKLCSLLLCLLALPVGAQTVTGMVRVIDGDTIDIGADRTIRLLGIDAAEGAQTCRGPSGQSLPCGRMATNAARDLYQGRLAQCEVRTLDRYGRALGVCTVDGVTINADLVARGWARTYREDRSYAPEQAKAKAARRGLWAYDMQDPALWRAGQRRSGAAPRGCAIKGNISANGRIFHVPGSRYYGDTRINTARGERWFCSDAEALAAGWRRPRR